VTDQIFPGVPVSVADFRRFVVQALAGLPQGLVEGGCLVASELATNAVTHSRSKLPGGKYLGRVEIGIDAVLIEVVDQGADDSAPEVLVGESTDEHGRGLFLCAAYGQLSTEITPGGRRTAARLPLSIPPASVEVPS
jgi:anti-sigma regulatory factor (Ser/Thr protein kinase)